MKKLEMLEVGGLRSEFRALFGVEPRLFAAPGRVNLIGEHTDYNEGFVLPMAIERETVVAARARSDRRIGLRSRNEKGNAEFDLDGPAEKRRGTWFDYVEGVARVLEARGMRLLGADLVFETDIPLGGGLSSSAALEIAAGTALLRLSGQELEPRLLALAGQAAEHEYVGTRCGIMDQYIVSMARPGHALLIDCRSLEPRYVPMSTGNVRVMICDTHVKHALATSEYNKRRTECEAAVQCLRGILPHVRALRDVSAADFDRHKSRLEPVLQKRCQHVVTENARALLAAEGLSTGRVELVGERMVESHVSLRDDYEVSAPELDVLVEAVLPVEGVFGARMTGGGFGGCTVTLLRESALQNAQEAAIRAFRDRFGKVPGIFVTDATGGARELTS